MNIFGNVSSIYYNLIFCVILAYSIQKTLKGFLFNRFRYHLISFILTGSLILLLSLTQGLGRGLNGICGFRVASKQSTTRFIIQIIISAICIYSMIAFRMKLPKNEFYRSQSLFGYYFYYMGVFAVTQIISSISYLVNDILCKVNAHHITQKLNILYSISIVSSIILSYFLIFMRFKHPLLIKKIKNIIGIKQNKQKSQQQQSYKGQSRIKAILKDLQQIQDQEQQSWLGCLLESLKGSQILSFLQGITIAFIQKQKKYHKNQLSPLLYKKHYTFNVNESIVQNYIERRISSRQSFIVQKKLGGLVGLDYTVTSYCPQVFSYICTRKEISMVIRSLDIKKNIKIVKKQSYMNGGKSGELFFNTYDGRIIFKSIREDQAVSYIDKINDFTEYYKKQKNSVIVKILGIFKFVRNDIKQDAIYIMLMYNITMLPRQYNLRVYDIKGSEFNRSTIQQNNINRQSNMSKNEQYQKDIKGPIISQMNKSIKRESNYNEQNLKRYTLKDKDFKQLESKISISQNQGKQLKRILKKDIQFLGGLGFIDYSLIIIKRQGQKSEKGNEKQINYNQLLSTSQQGVIYNFGIIDYLESWTLKRKAQRVLKTLITNQQVTAHSPINYAQRLSSFIQTII